MRERRANLRTRPALEKTTPKEMTVIEITISRGLANEHPTFMAAVVGGPHRVTVFAHDEPPPRPSPLAPSEQRVAPVGGARSRRAAEDPALVDARGARL